MSNLYVISGCNGAGKTTASLSILPEILDCHEFVNADMIAYGLSPLNVSGVAMQAGRIMLQRIKDLMNENKDFAFETTLATRSYVNLIAEARAKNYKISLLFFWLHSPEQAKERVAQRVLNGGHNIEDEVVERRYHRGIKNFFELYSPICDHWILIDNSNFNAEIIAQGGQKLKEKIILPKAYNKVKSQQDERSLKTKI